MRTETLIEFGRLIISWPVVVFGVVCLFRNEIRNLARRLENLKLGEVSFGWAQELNEAVFDALERHRSGTPDEGQRVQQEARRYSKVVTQLARPEAHLEGAVLWVDDQHANNKKQVRALRRLGLRVVLASSTEEALSALEFGPYDLVISDVARISEGPNAGFEMAKRMRDTGAYEGPLAIYCARLNDERRTQAADVGALGITNSFSELLLLVFDAIKR